MWRGTSFWWNQTRVLEVMKLGWGWRSVGRACSVEQIFYSNNVLVLMENVVWMNDLTSTSWLDLSLIDMYGCVKHVMSCSPFKVPIKGNTSSPSFILHCKHNTSVTYLQSTTDDQFARLFHIFKSFSGFKQQNLQIELHIVWSSHSWVLCKNITHRQITVMWSPVSLCLFLQHD